MSESTPRLSVSVEDYLKVIYTLSGSEEAASTSAIAEALGVQPASVTGMDLKVDAWQLDAVSVGLQKCLSGPPGVAPLTFNERIEAAVLA